MSVEFNVYKYENVLAAHVKGVLPTGSTKNFHLCLLIDKSSSMEGTRMNEVKNTLNELIRILKDDDKISLITYSTDAEVLINSLKAGENRDSMTTTVSNIVASGMTNLESALMKISTLTNLPDAIFILTDGNVNAGTMSSMGLQSIAHTVIHESVPLGTVGYGSDHNQVLLRDLAIQSRGTYTYADSDEMIPAIVGDICAGLWTEVGRNAKINIPPSFEVCEIGTDSTEHFKFGTIIDDKSQWIVFKGTEAYAIPTHLTLTYMSNEGDARTIMSGITYYDDPSYGVIVNEQSNRADVAISLFEATTLVKSGSIDIARTKLNELIARLDASISNNRPMVISLKAQVLDMISSLPIGASYYGGAGARAGAPSLAATVSRLASATAYVGNQRGVMSISEDPSTAAGGAGAGAGAVYVSGHATARASSSVSWFSSPAQVNRSISLVTSTHRHSHEMDEDNSDASPST